MDSFLKEIQNDIKAEKTERLVKKYLPFVVSIVAIGLVAIAGYSFYRSYMQGKYEETGIQFANAQKLLTQGKKEEATKAFTEISEKHNGAYSDAAGLILVKQLIAEDKITEAEAKLKSITSASSDKEFKKLGQQMQSLLGGESANDNTKLGLEARVVDLISEKKYEEALKLLNSEEAQKIESHALNERLSLLKEYVQGQL